MTPNKTRLVLTVLCMFTLASCGPQLSDTGYTGTWIREEMTGSSTLAIVSTGDGFLVRWGRQSEDGRLVVRCDWEGECEERHDGETVARYRFRTWTDERTGLLRVECRGETLGVDPLEVHYVDELVTRDDGLRLVSRNIENRGQRFEPKRRAKRSFEKISDSVVSPP